MVEAESQLHNTGDDELTLPLKLQKTQISQENPDNVTTYKSRYKGFHNFRRCFFKHINTEVYGKSVIETLFFFFFLAFLLC